MEALVDEIEDRLSRYAGARGARARSSAKWSWSGSDPLDRVAFVRYASVYRNFQDVGEFQEFVDEMTARQEREALRRNQVEFPF